MAEKTLITFDQGGGMRVENTGFVGTACAVRTEELIGNIGGKRVKEERKPEYNQVNRSTGKRTQTVRG